MEGKKNRSIRSAKIFKERFGKGKGVSGGVSVFGDGGGKGKSVNMISGVNGIDGINMVKPFMTMS